MNLLVHYRPYSKHLSQKQIINLKLTLTKAAFIKHMGIAGMHYTPRLHKLRRIVGMFLHYYDYFRDFSKNRFSEPLISDPTEKAQFSNLVGKAVADYLSKKLDHSRFTVSYESLMYKVIGSRPDLIAFKDDGTKFAIEAKGFSKSNIGLSTMNKYKGQATSGTIPNTIKVDFAMVSIAYNLYRKIECKYYDPPYENNYGENDQEVLRVLSKHYYGGFKEFLNNDFFEIEEKKYKQERFFIITPSSYIFGSYQTWFFFLPERWSLIITKKIGLLAREGITRDFKSFEIFEMENENENIYIDADGIGIRLVKNMYENC